MGLVNESQAGGIRLATHQVPCPAIESGRMHPEDVFTHRMGLSEAAEGYRVFDAREDGVLKVLLDPTR